VLLLLRVPTYARPTLTRFAFKLLINVLLSNYFRALCLYKGPLLLNPLLFTLSTLNYSLICPPKAYNFLAH
jgi:hypothetical protein